MDIFNFKNFRENQNNFSKDLHETTTEEGLNDFKESKSSSQEKINDSKEIITFLFDELFKVKEDEIREKALDFFAKNFNKLNLEEKEVLSVALRTEESVSIFLQNIDLYNDTFKEKLFLKAWEKYPRVVILSSDLKEFTKRYLDNEVLQKYITDFIINNAKSSPDYFTDEIFENYPEINYKEIIEETLKQNVPLGFPWLERFNLEKIEYLKQLIISEINDLIEFGNQMEWSKEDLFNYFFNKQETAPKSIARQKINSKFFEKYPDILIQTFVDLGYSDYIKKYKDKVIGLGISEDQYNNFFKG